ncbi:MAG: RluA family pseudouridine synthase [Bacteroidales bacterium]|jgi:23S rRNA pseudouridine1911/1915/1917 synthase|nr:RluA family pseudouridine synthase [Bacteroidales bacterium]MDD3914840.1 RluA family pseudouridine synthase [Bacteroidales bacterium]MDD4633843.1 RluA family pseudouridine synthase [Bacteroidales bacterium]
MEELEKQAIDTDNELYEHYRVVVDKGQSPLRIDKFLFSRIENASRNKIQNAAKAECILVNGIAVKQNYKIKPQDIISIVMPEPPRNTEVIPQDIPIDIVYEDDDILIVNKAAGMVVHPSYANYDGTLVNALTYYLNQEGKGEKPELVHRIDKDTTGLLLVAKNEIAQTKLAKQFYDHSIERRYQALVWGDFDEDEGTINGNLARHPKDRRIVAVYPDGSQGRTAITHYKVLERFGYVTLIECKLETGRTHQIRAHLQFIKHPLFGDPTYGGDIIVKGTTFTKYKQFVTNCFSILPRQALHAKTLGFIHPTTNKFIQFDSELPDDMKEVLEKWRKYKA